MPVTIAKQVMLRQQVSCHTMPALQTCSRAEVMPFSLKSTPALTSNTVLPPLPEACWLKLAAVSRLVLS